jgi:hypothetical protein
MTEIRNDAKKRFRNWFNKKLFTTWFFLQAVKQEIKNLENGIEGKLVKELKEKEGLKTDEEVINVLEEIINPSTVTR